MSFDERTFRRLCEQLERELHRGLTPDEVRALRLAQPLSPPPEPIERRAIHLQVVPDRRTTPE